jgi:general secretion pathway protein G
MKQIERKNRKRNNKGFTLIEIMIVLGIVGMLFGFVGVNLIGKFKESKISAAKIQMASYGQALQAYYLSHSNYPSTAQGLQALVSAPTVGKIPKNYPEGGYLGKKTLPKDPFGNDYRYECEDNQNYTISSDGPDGQPGTDDDVVQE